MEKEKQKMKERDEILVLVEKEGGNRMNKLKADI